MPCKRSKSSRSKIRALKKLLKIKDTKIEELNQKVNNCECKEEEIVSEIEENVSPMELMLANPGLESIPEKIFGYLDLKSLTKCREVSKNCKNLIDNKKSLILLKIKHLKNHKRCYTDSRTRRKTYMTFLENVDPDQEYLQEWETLFEWFSTSKAKTQNCKKMFNNLEFYVAQADFGSVSPKVFCIEGKMLNPLEMLLQTFSFCKNDPTLFMENYLYPEAFELILKHASQQGFNLNYTPDYQEHITHFAYKDRSYQKEFLELLLKNENEYKIDFRRTGCVTWNDEWLGKTVLQIAQENEDWPVVALFKKYGKVLIQ